MVPLNRALALLGQSGYTYLLLARFSADIAAPLPSSLPVDVGGPLTTVQVDGQMSQSGGKLVFPAQTSAVDGDQAIIDPTSRSRTAGRALIGDLQFSSLGQLYPGFGWYSSTTPTNGTRRAALHALGGTLILRIGSGVLVNPIGTITTGTSYQVALILRSSGVLCFIRGGAYATWTLLWVDNNETTTPLYAALVNYDAAGTLDNFRVLDLGLYDARFATDYGLATNRLLNPAAGATTTSTADAVIEWTFSYNGTAMYFQYRSTDALNGWEVDAESGTVFLYQVVAGAYTSRGSSGSTFTATNTYRVVIVAEGNVHRVYVNNVLKIGPYTDGGNFQNTATRIEADAVSGGMSEVIAWPRTVVLPNV